MLHLRRSVIPFALLAATTLINAQTLDSEQASFLTLINNYRTQNGLAPLQVSPSLQNAAQWMSADMAAKSYFSHTDSLGRSPFQRMAAFGYSYSYAGENIAAGNSGAQATFNQWQGSPGHNQNMLNPNYRAIGIGRAYNVNAPYRWYWTTDFGNVVDGGTPPPAGDTQAPSTPATLYGMAQTETTVGLQWSASTDNVGVSGYQVLRNGGALATVSGSTTTYTDRSAAAGTTYTYSVRAYDGAGNYSGASPSATVTTPGSATPVPASVAAVSGSGQSAAVATTFAARLRVRVLTAAGQPVNGATVTFTAPTTGATAMFTGFGNVATARTDATGIAQSPAVVANGTPGTYTIRATVSGVATAATFTLTNTSTSNPPTPAGGLSIWSSAAAPTTFMRIYSPMELGVKFRSDVSGRITGVRFYKSSMDTGTHRGSLWSADGKLLATGTFTNETASGWQTLTFSAPVTIAANTTYVASYHTTGGVYAVTTSELMNKSVSNSTLRALQYGVSGPNGVLLPTDTSAFPTWGSYGNNYWVDVIFTR